MSRRRGPAAARPAKGSAPAGEDVAVPAEDAAVPAEDVAVPAEDADLPAEQADGTAAPRRPSPGAKAATRARRIGGRPSSAPGAASRGGSAEPAPEGPVASSAAERPRAAERSKRVGAGGSRATGATDSRPQPRPQRAGTAQRPARAVADRTRDDKARVTDTPAPGRQLGWLRWIPALVAGLAAVALLVANLWELPGALAGKPADHSNKTRQEVLAAAKTCGAAIVSYDYRQLAASEKAGQACITGKFRDDYTKAMETTVRTLAPQTKTVQVFQIAKAGVERVSPDGKQWVVLLYGQQQVTNTSTAKNKPRLDILTVEATLDRVGDTWLVSSIH